MALVWSQELSVGNAMIDSEHKNLIVMVNSLRDMIGAKDCSALPQAFEQLEYCLSAHFANEAKLAQAINFPFSYNALAHQHLQNALQLIKDAVAVKSGIWAADAAEHYSEFLSDWLTSHVINEDMLMKPALLAYPYEFNPG